MAGKKSKKSREPVSVDDLSGLEDRIVERLSSLVTTSVATSVRVEDREETILVEDGGDVPEDAVESVPILAALGHPVRMNMCVLGARGPLGVTSYVEQLGLGTAGQAYHHLRALVDAGVFVHSEHGYGLNPRFHSRLRAIVTLARRLEE